MALRDAIEDIAQEIEEDSKNLPSHLGDAMDYLKGYAKQLRRAIKASEGEFDSPFASSHRLAAIKEKALEDARIAKSREAQREIEGSRMVMAADGPHEGTYAPINNSVPEGAALNLMGCRYVVAGNELRYRPEVKEG